MSIDRIALILVVVLASIYVAVLLLGLIGLLPYGLPLLVVFLVVGYLFWRVVKDRLTNSEDDYYDKNIDQ